MARKAAKAEKGPRKPPQALMKALDRIAAAMEGPLHRAQTRCFDVMEATTESTRLGRAAEALETSPLAADAWGILAQAAPEGSELALLLWRPAVAAGTLAIGPLALSLEPGEYWGVLETRPCMRARCGLALELWRQGQRAAAITEAEEMLRLNPNDDQGMRDALLDWLLAEGRDAEAAALHARYAEDGSATWAYGAALLAFRKDGAGGAADAALAEAVEANRHVAAVMLGREEPVADKGFYSHGSPEEAARAAPAALPAWKATEGALDWLATRPGDAAPPTRRGRKPRAAT